MSKKICSSANWKRIFIYVGGSEKGSNFPSASSLPKSPISENSIWVSHRDLIMLSSVYIDTKLKSEMERASAQASNMCTSPKHKHLLLPKQQQQELKVQSWKISPFLWSHFLNTEMVCLSQVPHSLQNPALNTDSPELPQVLFSTELVKFPIRPRGSITGVVRLGACPGECWIG